MERNKTVNLIKIAILILLLVQIGLSFAPCLKEYMSGSADNFSSRSETGYFMNNACWLIVIVSTLEMVTLFFNNKSCRTLFHFFSLLAFVITLCYPYYLSATHSLFGEVSVFQRTISGVVVLSITFIVFVGMIVYNKLSKKYI